MRLKVPLDLRRLTCVNTRVTPPAEWTQLGSSDKDALIQALLGQLAELKARVQRLEAENAELSYAGMWVITV